MSNLTADPCPKPVLNPADCNCDANPTISKYVICNGNNPGYVNSMDDLPNGACIMYVDGQRSGTSLGICEKNEDCAGELLCGNQGFCVDGDGVLESDRIVQSCVSPKMTAEDNGYMGDRWLAGCPEGYDSAKMLECHRWWIGEEGMVWKRYLQGSWG